MDKFEIYADMLIEENRKHNLTTVTDRNEIYTRHFDDSLSVLPYLKSGTLIDIGSGAGFPGVPIAIERPAMQVTLLESIGKKTAFLEKVKAELELDNVTVINARAEGAAKTELRESFDFAVSRAVARLNTLLEYCLPFVKSGGLFASYKSADFKDELEKAKNALKILGAELAEAVAYESNGVTRSLLIFKKTAATPNKYPRSGNKPRKLPL